MLIPQLDGLKDSIAALGEANLWWVGIALVVYFLGVPPVMALQFMVLAFRRIAFMLTLKVELAGLFVSKLLPNGIGSISLNMFYFIKQKHSISEATSVMAMDAVTSGIAYMLLVLLALMSSSVSFEGASSDITIPTNLLFFLGILLLGVIYFVFRSVSLRTRLIGAWHEFKGNFAQYKERPSSIFLSILGNGISSAACLFALYASGHALGVDISFADAVVAYSFGNIAATLVPTPGGIGATEAGLYAGLVLTGVSGPDAILVTLLFRLLTYWIPMAVGYFFFWGLRKNVLSDFSVRKSYDH